MKKRNVGSAPARAIVAAAALAAVGCASTEETAALREQPGFLAGLSDGCVTATEENRSFSTRVERDASAFENDEAYRAGWRQGYLECETKTPRTRGGGVILGERGRY